MESAILVIDEWLWADLGGDEIPKRTETYQFLRAVLAKCDRIVMVEDSRFAEKASAFWRHTDWPRRQIAIFFNENFRWTRSKTVIAKRHQLLELPKDLQDEVKPKDQYLVSAFLTTNAQVIVTTDNPLMDALRRHGIACEHREQFLPSYIERYRAQTQEQGSRPI